jgi:PAS domain S-box-containing protein
VNHTRSTTETQGSNGQNVRRFGGSGEMDERIRQKDWSATALGPVESWSDALVNAVNMILGAPVPMQLFWGPELVVLYNDALIPIMTTKHPGALGQPARVCWEEAWPIVGPQLDRVLSKGEAISFTNVLVPITRDGLVRDVYWNYSYSPWLGSDGSVEGVLDIAFDTTEAVEAQKRLQESEERAVRVLQSIGDAVIVTDANSKVTRINPVAQQLTGWSQDEAYQVPLSQVFRIINETTREPVEIPSEKSMQQGEVIGLANHTVLIARDGSEINIDDTGAPIRDDSGNVCGAVLVFRNISERRRAERERNALTTRLNQVMQATSDAIVSVDRNWVMTYINPKAEAIYSPGGPILGQKVWDRFPGAVYEGSPYGEHYNRAMNDRIAGEFEAYYPEPLNVWLKIEVYPTEEGLVTFSRDVTREKNTTSALIQTEKLAAVGRLAASIAHEINNPLEAVTNLLYLAQASNRIEEVKDYLKTAEAELTRVSVISSQTLRFYKQSSAPREVTFPDLIGTVLAVHHAKLENAHVQLERRDRTDESFFCFDGEIRQVLNNLVSNAVDAMGSTGGKLFIRSRKSSDPKTGRRGITITVADNGSGINPTALTKIFEAFFTTKGATGNGLGLWVSKQIIANHEGTLRVRSTQQAERHGTVFTLFLPSEAVKR